MSLSKGTPTLLPISLDMKRHDDLGMVALVSGRVDLRKKPDSGRLRCGVDPLGAHRVARLDPRSNSRKRKAKEADRMARQLWLSHPLLPGAWLLVWVSPAVFEIAKQFEIFYTVEPVDREEQLLVGVLQRISDLRMLGVVIASEWTENHRRQSGAEVARYELLSGISTTPPPEGETVLDFSAELARLFAESTAQKAVLDEIARQAAKRERHAKARLAKAAAAMLPATASNDNEEGAA